MKSWMTPPPTPPPSPSPRGVEASVLAQILEIQADLAAVELDPAAIMRHIAQHTQTLTGADGVVIETVDGDQMVYRAASGSVAEHVGLRMNVDTSLAGHCALSGEWAYCRDTETDARVNREVCRRSNIRSMVVVPLPHHGRLVGVLKVLSSRADAFDEPAILALRLMAGMLAAALSNAAEFEEKKKLLAQRSESLASLQTSEQAYRTTFELAGVGMAHTDLKTGRFLRVNRKLCQITGYSSEELCGMRFADITHPDDQAASHSGALHLHDGKQSDFATQKRYIRKDGGTIWVTLDASVVRDVDGKVLYAVAMLRDITEHKLAEILEADRGEVLELVARDRPLPEVLERVAHLVERQVDGAAAAVMALSDGDLSLHAPRLPADLIEQMKHRRLPLASKLAQSVWDTPLGIGISELATHPAWDDVRGAALASTFTTCWAVLVAGSDGVPLGLLAALFRGHRLPTDSEARTLALVGRLATISIEHDNATRHLAHLVRHDRLTGLANRILFEDRLHHAIALARRTGKSAALLALDLDRFKSVNDTYGHAAGDQLLQQFAQRLRSQLRQTDTMARVGGDEFSIVLPQVSRPDEAAKVAQKLVECLAEPFEIGDTRLRATTSIGIALLSGEEGDTVTLQKQSDAALYRVKQLGRNGYSF